MGVRDGRPSIHTINLSFIFIPKTTNGFLVHAMIDTGSTHTLITLSLLKTFPRSSLQKTPTTNAMLGDADAPIAVHGLVHLCVYVNHIPTGGGKIIGPPLVNAKKLTFCFKKRSVRLVNIFDRNIGICDILVCLYSLFSSFKCM